MRTAVFAIALLSACGPEAGVDSATDPGTCSGSGPVSLIIGQGTGGAFEEIQPGSVVPFIVAQQGGMGVIVRAKTTGLAEGTTVMVLDTRLEGALSASFPNDAVMNFCQEDGSGLMTDQNVALDEDEFEGIEDMAPLIGSDIELVITATDSNGRTASGSVMVQFDISR